MQSQNEREELQDEVSQLPRQLLNRKTSELSELQLRYTYSNTSSASQLSIYEAPLQDFQLKFFKDEETYSSLLEKVQQLKNILWIEDDHITLYIFYHYEWNQQKLMARYFNEDWSKLKQKQASLSHIHNFKSRKDICSVCEMETQLFSNLMCEHQYCKNCWISYIRQNLLQGNIFFNCMNGYQCNQSPVLKPFVDFLTPQLSQLYRKKICAKYTIQDRSVSYCPSQKCPYFCQKPEMMEIQNVCCPCGKIYCFRCEQQPHNPVKCSDVVRWRKMLNAEETNASWIQRHTRKCPKCHLPIQKKVGCAHMKCICACEFCYECNQTWGEEHRLRSECPYKNEGSKPQKKSAGIAELNNKLIGLMREAENNMATIYNCKNMVQDEGLKAQLNQLKTEVLEAWMALKWTQIYSFMENRKQVEYQLQNEYIGSIRAVLEPIQNISKNYGRSTRDLHTYREQVLIRKEALRRNKAIWLEAWNVLF